MKDNVHPGSLELLVCGRLRQQDQIVSFSLTLKSKLCNSPSSSAAHQLLSTLYSARSLKSPERTQMCNKPGCIPLGAQMPFQFYFCPLLFETNLETKGNRLRKPSPLIVIRTVQSPGDQSPDYIGLERTTETLISNMKKSQAGGLGRANWAAPGPAPASCSTDSPGRIALIILSKDDVNLPHHLFYHEINEIKSQITYLP